MLENICIDKIFVYGTLRPDIHADWSDSTHKNSNFSFRYDKAHLYHSKLFLNKNAGYPYCVYDPAKYSKDEFTVGYILQADNIIEALKFMDRLEGIPDYYDRKVVPCFNLESQVEEDVFFYTIGKDASLYELFDFKINDWALYTPEKEETDFDG